MRHSPHPRRGWLTRALPLAAAFALYSALDFSSSPATRRLLSVAGYASAYPGGITLIRGADLVLLHGRIWTGEPYAKPGEKAAPARFAEAAAVTNGRILAVGSDREMEAYVGPNSQTLDLHGRFAMPGFIDSHVHFMNGSFQLLQIDLKYTTDEADFRGRIAEKARTLKPGEWMLGGDWDEEAWPDAKLPTRWMIDAVTPENPVWISRYDGHAALANSLALKLAGITRETHAPIGGVIVRDPDTGEPTGVLKDAAQSLVYRAVPPPTEPQFEQALRTGLAEARRVGVTSVEDISVSSDSPNGKFTGEIDLLRRAEREGWLTCRFYEITPVAAWQSLEAAGISHAMGSDFLKMGALKAFADGSLGSRTAWMFEPYSDDPENVGLGTALMTPPAKMLATLAAADKAGIQLAVHSIGDRANSEMLDIYQQIGGSNPAAHRFRIEHAQHLRAVDIPRFGKLGVIASMQPYHAIDDGRWAEKRIGHDRARTSYAWRSLLDAGAPLAFGTDWPVAPLNPLPGVYAAVIRATLDGKHPDGWFPEQRLTLEEALRAYTQGSAYAAFAENEKGTIAPGKLADLVVLSEDLFRIPPDRIKGVEVLTTIVGGKVVYSGGGQ